MEPKKNPKVDAGRNSSFYFSLGLISALSLCFVILQTEFKANDNYTVHLDPIEEQSYYIEPIMAENIKIVEEKVKKTQVLSDNIVIIEPDNPVEQEVETTTELMTPGENDGTKTPEVVSASQMVTVVEEPENVEVKFEFIEDVPVFPGCEKLPKNQHRACFEKKLKEHVMKHQRFPEQAIESNLSGRVHAQFIIDENGQVKIANMRSSHPLFEKEVYRVLNLLPQMTPGKQRLKPVKVSYIIPFAFKVD